MRPGDPAMILWILLILLILLILVIFGVFMRSRGGSRSGTRRQLHPRPRMTPSRAGSPKAKDAFRR
ncbi:hypothetical protein [Streptomyces sp. BA2]|uniref:hypothetical protein n=1 Tax=Streptomyces sp. BA2 TaxID=436595 RepID=UPI00132263E7|nr:hypothetical protein [Streptomyces sp. BA2]MWA14436.1 hypothetical protein [Streptomyces sp. BA2]